LHPGRLESVLRSWIDTRAPGAATMPCQESSLPAQRAGEAIHQRPGFVAVQGVLVEQLEQACEVGKAIGRFDEGVPVRTPLQTGARAFSC
jgi:hypothetical protein